MDALHKLIGRGCDDGKIVQLFTVNLVRLEHTRKRKWLSGFKVDIVGGFGVAA